MIDGKCEDDLSIQLCRFVTGETRLFSAICWERRWTGYCLRCAAQRPLSFARPLQG